MHSQQDANYDSFEKTHERAMQLVVRASRIFSKAEDLLTRQYREIKATGDLEVLDHALARLVTFHEIQGHYAKAERYLREREATFPRSLEAKFATARYLGYSLRNPKLALWKLRQVRLPRKPGEFDFDTYYNALNVKGVMLLWAGKPSLAKRNLAELVRFTRQNFGQIKFFFDLSFVEMMIERRLSLRDCRKYLEILRKRKQVIHDQKKTIALLRKVKTPQ